MLDAHIAELVLGMKVDRDDLGRPVRWGETRAHSPIDERLPDLRAVQSAFAGLLEQI